MTAENNPIKATIYTDGSCHTTLLAGAWVAIILAGKEKKLLSGTASNTTHNRMELTAVIEAIEYIKDYYPAVNSITVCSDSQYVVGLQAREEKIRSLSFASKKGKALQNDDLLKKILALFALYTVECIKIKAHEKLNDSNAYNIEADMLSRKMVRAAVNE